MKKPRNIRYTLHLTISLLLSIALSAQKSEPTNTDVLQKFGFEEQHVLIEGDTTFLYVHQKPGALPVNLVLHFQGTSPDPLFSEEKEGGKYGTYRWFP